MISLYPDQQESIAKLRAAMARRKRILLQGETGSGKSVMASYMISSALAKGNRAAFVVPRKELRRQMSETFSAFNIPHSYVAAGNPFNPYSKAYLCTVGSLARRLSKIQPNVIFIDETHHGEGQLNSIIEHYAAQGAWVIGLTATPDNPNLHKWYDDLICGPSIRDLIDMKRLSDFRYFAPTQPDLSRIGKVAGEYHKGQLDSFMYEQQYIVGDAIKHYSDHAMGRTNMVFCTSIRTSERTAQQFRDAGIPAIHMDGETPEAERRKIARAFALREILVLCTVDLVLFGYDLASASGIKNANVECMSDLRPTRSRNTQRQKIGRVLRYKDYPALIFDHSSNCNTHGLPDEPVEWSLEPPETGMRDNGEKTIPTRQCERCFRVHRPAPVCPSCGHVYEVKSREIDALDGELQEVDIEAQRRALRTEQGRARTLDELIEYGKKTGKKYPAKWAAHVLAARMRKHPT